jgi:glycopeptide antibiotics resistance protein
MTEISFAAGMALTCVCWLLFRCAAYLKTRVFRWQREAVLLLLLVNFLVLVRMTFYPFETLNGNVQPLLFEPDKLFPLRINLVPFVNILDYESTFDILINIIGNSTMFVPTGILLPLLYPRFDSWKRIFLAGLAVSLTIELLQLPFAVRASDVDDLILNVVGCLLGYGILYLVRLAGRFIRRKSSC